MSTSESQVTNRFIKAFAALMSLLVVFALVAGVYRLVKGEDESSEVSWLYSQTSDSGELDDLGGGRYHLVMRGVDYHTVQFSDRPDRLVKILDTADFVHHWDEMFASSAPNAVLVEHEPDGSTDSLVVVLQKPHFDYENDEITYEAQVLADEFHPERLKKLANAHPEPPANMRAVSLFIDSVTSYKQSMARPIFDGPYANELKTKLGLDKIPTSNLSVGSGVYVVSAAAKANENGVISGDVVVGFNKGATSPFTSLQLKMSFSVTDANNWSFATTTAASTPYSPPNIPGLTVDPSAFSGSIEKVDGAVKYKLTTSSHSWQVASGATYVSTLSFTSDCPLEESHCLEFMQGPFISMDGSLTIQGFPNTIAMKGAMTPDAQWARFDGSAGDLTFEKTGITNAVLTIWRGDRSDSYDANMNLPSLQKLTNGNNMEFCGGFTISIPKITNKSTSGCVRWSPSGVVIGQVGIDASLSGTMSSTGSTANASTQVKGLAWTNIPSASLANLPSVDAVMNGVASAIKEKKIVLAGKAALPGVVAKALNINLGSASTLAVDVTGEVSATGFTLTGDINTNIVLGSEPFKLTVRKIGATISMEQGSGASFSVGTTGNATVGYAPNSRTLQTSVNLVAATSPNTGMALSVNARGTAAAADANNDGLTTATRLTNPGAAQYVWPNQFGIKGLNLWNLTVQVAYQDGSPALGYTSTTYMDPNGANTGKVLKCTGPCDGSDWMVGTLGFNISYTNPCFAYSFNSASGTSAFVIDGGAMKATSFGVGVAPTGCSIQSGSTQQELEAGYVGFKFSGSFGDTTLDVATQTSKDGFVFDFELDNLVLAGFTYKTVTLDIVINEKGSDISFGADMSTKMGSMTVTMDFAGDSSAVSQTMTATLSDWTWARSGTIDLKTFTFSSTTTIPTDGSCAYFKGTASGQATIGATDIALEEATMWLSCKSIDKLAFKVNYAHQPKWGGGKVNAYLNFQYPLTFPGQSGKYFSGSAEFSYKRSFSREYKDRDFDRNVSIDFYMSLMFKPGSASSTADFKFSGSFDADRVSGDISGEMDADGKDFTVGGEMRLNPSWAGVYHFKWNDL
ncbi:MAG: hypothetical protein RL114_872 [Actinomycetota bacterium]|jgi:hypothetical protein